MSSLTILLLPNPFFTSIKAARTNNIDCHMGYTSISNSFEAKRNNRKSNRSFDLCINQGEVHKLAFCDVMSHAGHRCRNFAGPGVSQRRSRRQASSLYSASQRKWRLNFKWSEDNCCLQRFEFFHFKYLLSLKERQA